jgi:hypothetical protein
VLDLTLEHCNAAPTPLRGCKHYKSERARSLALTSNATMRAFSARTGRCTVAGLFSDMSLCMSFLNQIACVARQLAS